ncbi:MAG: hypothetical protein AABX12_02165 [Nanoarchaeota archaeon]
MLDVVFLTTIGNSLDEIPEALGRRISEHPKVLHKKLKDFLIT